MNKNTKRLSKLKRQALKRGEHSVTIKVPVYNYHSDPKLIDKTFTFVGGSGVVMQSPRRNLQMVILTNTDEKGRKTSLTVHEPIRKDSAMGFKNHNYLKDNYVQKK